MHNSKGMQWIREYVHTDIQTFMYDLTYDCIQGDLALHNSKGMQWIRG